MLVGLEFIIAAAAVVGAIAMFVLALRRRPAVDIARQNDTSGGAIVATNFYALAIIGLLFFGISFLIDVFS